MPRIKITGLPKAQVGVQSGFFKPVSGPSLSTPKSTDVAMLPLREQYEDDASYQQALYEYSVDQSPIGAMPKPKILQDYKEPNIEAPSGDDWPIVSLTDEELNNPPEQKWGPHLAPPTNRKKQAFNKGVNKFAKLAPKFDLGVGIASAGVGFVDNKIKQKEFDKWQRQGRLPDNYYAVNTTEDRGDYDVNNGMFRPNLLGFKSKGQTANAYYSRMNQAANGMIVPGDEIVQASFLPDVSTSVPSVSFVPRVENAAAAPIASNTTSTGNVSLSDDFVDYAIKAQKYINKVNPKTDITGEILAAGAQTAFKKYGKIVPVQLALAQLQEEGYLAKQSKPNKPQRTKNPFNVGNTDDGSVVDYSQRGLQPAVNTYFNLIARSYLKNKTPEELLNNFTNYRGERYASGKEYESSLKTLVNKINNTISTDVAKNKPNMKIRIVGIPDQNNQMADGGEQEGIQPINPLLQNVVRKPVGFGFNFNRDNLYDISGGVKSNIQNDNLNDTNYNLNLKFPQLFGEGHGLGLTGNYSKDRLNLGANARFRTGKSGALTLTGGYSQNYANNEQQQPSPNQDFMRGNPSFNSMNAPKSNFNAGVNWQGKVGKTNVKLSGYYGQQPEMAHGGQPAYSGQSDYGLYIGQRNLYSSMPENPYKDPKNSVTEEEETKDNPYVLEAEGGETILRPDGTHMNINGPSHAEGGVKLTKEQAPPKSFIFSQTGKMKIKNPEVLKHFGKGYKKGGITPAEIAKQYNVNKYIAILQDPHADKLSKDTAMKMVENYQRKLAELSLAQESIKGFPQGIPDIAKAIMQDSGQEQQGEMPAENQEMETGKYGGSLRKFVGGGPNDPDPFGVKALLANTGRSNVRIPYRPDYPGAPTNPDPLEERAASNLSGVGPAAQNVQRFVPSWFKYWTTSNTPKGKISPKGPYSTYDKNAGNKVYDDYNYWRSQAGRDFSGPADYQKFVFSELQKRNPNAYKHIEKTWGPTAAGKWDDAIMGARTAYASSSRIPDDIPGTTPTTTKPPEVITTTTKGPEVITTTTKGPEVVTTTTMAPESSRTKAGWTSQDLRNVANAAMDYGTLKKYHPWSATVQPVLPNFVPVDWRGYAASLQSGANTAANQLATYQPGQSQAANLSMLAGQQAENLGKYIGQTDVANAAAATQNDAQRADILNRFTIANAERKTKLGDDEMILDDRFRTGERLGRKGIVKTVNQAEDTSSKIYNLNQVQSPYFTIDPFTQKRVFNSAGAKAAWEAATRGGADPGAGARAASELKSIYDSLTFIPEDKRYDAALKVWSGDNNTGKTTSRNYASQPNKNYTQTTQETDNT
jgi:hypothetical protein